MVNEGEGLFRGDNLSRTVRCRNNNSSPLQYLAPPPVIEGNTGPTQYYVLSRRVRVPDRHMNMQVPSCPINALLQRQLSPDIGSKKRLELGLKSGQGRQLAPWDCLLQRKASGGCFTP